MTQTFPNYRALFTRMVDDLRCDRLFVVERFVLGDPLSLVDIQALETETGYELTNDLRAFYAQMNGLNLKWYLDPNLSDADREAFFLEFPDMDVENSSDEAASAAIRILPLHEVLTRHWGEDVYYEPEMGFHGEALSIEDFHANMRPFDLFSDYRACILAFRQKRIRRCFFLTITTLFGTSPGARTSARTSTSSSPRKGSPTLGSAGCPSMAVTIRGSASAGHSRRTGHQPSSGRQVPSRIQRHHAQ